MEEYAQLGEVDVNKHDDPLAISRGSEVQPSLQEQMRELPAQHLRGSLLSSIYASQEQKRERGKRSSIVGSVASQASKTNGMHISQDMSEILPSPYSKVRNSRKDFLKRFGSFDSEAPGEQDQDQVQTVAQKGKITVIERREEDGAKVTLDMHRAG